MSAIATIAVLDGQTTPVNHNLIPTLSGPVAAYRENITGLALIGQITFKTQLMPDSGNGLNRVKLTLNLPALEVSTGQNASGYTAGPKVGFTNKVDVIFTLPSRGTGQQRKDLRTLIKNLLGDTQIIDLVENLAPQY